MKRIQLSLLFVALLVLLTGCSGAWKSNSELGTGAPTINQSVGTVTLRYMIWDKNQVHAYQKIIAAFRQIHPEINIDIQVIPWSNYWEKLMTEIAGGTAPDVFWGYIPRVPSLAERNALLPISEYIKREVIDLASLNQALVKGFNYKGEQYGIPKDWDSMGVFYNKTLLKQAGYEKYPQHLSWNPEDGGSFVKFLQDLTVDANGKHPYEQGFDPNNIVQYGINYTDRGEWDPGEFVSFAKSNGAELMVNGQFKPSDRLIAVMQFVNDLVFKYHVAPKYMDIKLTGSDQMFVSGQTVLWITGSWQMMPVKQKASFEWGIAALPNGPGQRRAVRVNGLADHIYAHTPHKDEAWQFVQFILSKDAQDILAETGTVFPVNPQSIPKFVDFYQSRGIDPRAFVQSFNAETVTTPVTKNYAEWVQVWYKNMALIFSGGLDLKTGIRNIEEEGKKITG